ncbi:hypothetical protein J6590_066281 [Homalodisca vitripennis]|nr:hypothetical protein J6590_066281 [Homalodisca vitripennis]
MFIGNLLFKVKSTISHKGTDHWRQLEFKLQRLPVDAESTSCCGEITDDDRSPRTCPQLLRSGGSRAAPGADPSEPRVISASPPSQQNCSHHLQGRL